MFSRRKLLLDLFKLADVGILVVSLLFTWLITNQTKESALDLEQLLELRISLVDVIVLLCIGISWEVIFHGFQLYRSRRLDSQTQEWKDVIKATTTGTVVILLFGQVISVSVPVSFFYNFWFLSTILTISSRSILRQFLKMVRSYGRNLRFVLIVGTNQRACNFFRKIEANKGLGYRVLGFIDDNIHCTGEEIKLLGNLRDFSDILKSHVIDEVLIALPIKSQYEQIQRIIEKAEEQGIIIRYLYQPFDTKPVTLRTAMFADCPILTVGSRSHNYWQCLAKRIVDIILGSALVILTSPLILAAAVAIKVTSPGPVLFIQERVGYNKRRFRLYKFRTMVVGAEKEQDKLKDLNEMDGPVFKIRNDPRITKTGHWLRRTSIDELPQLFNVLKGDMALVGPRPLPVGDYNGFNEDWQRKRFSIKPGITCTWQINGRNNISFEKWMKLDIEYIDNWTLIGDLKILVKTVPVVICRKGAM